LMFPLTIANFMPKGLAGAASLGSVYP
jgi:hypothetical protein